MQLTLTQVLTNGVIEKVPGVKYANVFIRGKEFPNYPDVIAIEHEGKSEYQIFEEALLIHLGYDEEEV